MPGRPVSKRVHNQTLPIRPDLLLQMLRRFVPGQPALLLPPSISVRETHGLSATMFPRSEKDPAARRCLAPTTISVAGCAAQKDLEGKISRLINYLRN